MKTWHVTENFASRRCAARRTLDSGWTAALAMMPAEMCDEDRAAAEAAIEVAMQAEAENEAWVAEAQAREQEAQEQEGEPALSAKAQGKRPFPPAPAPVFSIGAPGPPIAAISLEQQLARASLIGEFRDIP